MAQVVPTIKVRIAAHPRLAQDQEDPLVEVVSEEEIVNSQPAITAAVSDFIKRHRPVKLGTITVQRI